ncbi:MAG: hypothetical protein ACT4PZ_19750 [Panacagrimonas sp.]
MITLKERKVTVACAGALICLVGACATSVDVVGRFPARHEAAARLRTVAVSGFDGPGGERFASALEARLASIRFDGKPYFALRGGAFDLAFDSLSAARYGRSVEAEAVYFGQVDAEFESAYVRREVRGKCRERKKDGNCKRYYQYSALCEDRSFKLTAFPKAVSVTTGGIVYSAQKVSAARTTHCPDHPGRPDSDLVADAEQQLLAEIAADVAPQNRSVRAKVNEDAEGLGEVDALLFEGAVESVTRGNPAAACQTWSQINEWSPLHRPTIFNLGMCAETEGRFLDALSYYERARADGEIAIDEEGAVRTSQSPSALRAMLGSDIRKDTDSAIARVRELVAAEDEVSKSADE